MSIDLQVIRQILKVCVKRMTKVIKIMMYKMRRSGCVTLQKKLDLENVKVEQKRPWT